MIRFSSLPLLALALSAATASAHGLWIEPTKDGASVHYGEYSHGEKESKDKLSSFAAALKVRDAAGKPVDATLREDGFYATTGASGTGVTATVIDGPVYGKGDRATRYQAFLRLASWGEAVAPAADFPVDVVPVEGQAAAFTVYKGGKAAGGSWVEVTAPNGWSKWFEADSTGRLVIEAPWSGLYLLHAEHEDETAGTTPDGKKFAKSNRSVTLSVRKP